MANIKFSQFTNQAAADTTYLVGYDGTTNTNYDKAQVKNWLNIGTDRIPTLYNTSASLTESRTVTLAGFDLRFTATGTGKIVYVDGNQAAGKVLKSDGSGTASWGAETDTGVTGVTLSIGTGQTSPLAESITNRELTITSNKYGGTNQVGYVPEGGTATTFLRGDGTWVTPANIANDNLIADAARTLTMGAHNLTIASTTTGQEVKFGQNVRVDGQGYTLQNDQSGITIDWDTGNVQYIALASGSQTFAPNNAESGATYILQLRQPGSGATGTINWNNLVNWPGGTDPTLTATNGAFDIITLMYNGTLSKYFGTVVLDLK